MTNLWQQAIQSIRSKKDEEPAFVSEQDRILALPKVDYYALGDYTAKLRLPGAPKGFTTSRGEYIAGLNVNQSALLHAVEHCGGAIGAIAVGGGKAAAALLSGVAANADCTIVLCPPSTQRQLYRTVAEWKPYYRMPRNLRIYSYDKISRDPGLLTKTIGNHQRVMLACDEVHALANPDSARTRRVQRFLDANPQVMFVGLSGTITSKSLHQMAHIFQWALREKSPLPIVESDYLAAWANCCDVKGRPGPLDWSMIEKLAVWHHGMPLGALPDKTAAAREALAERIRTAPGVVATTGGALGTSLLIEDVDGPKVTVEVNQMLADLRERQEIIYTDEDGRQRTEILTDDTAIWRAGHSLSMGFFYMWDWPKTPDGNAIIDHDWLDARADWNAAIRAELKHHAAENYDSPGTITDTIAIELGAGLNGPVHEMYRKWIPHSVKRWQGQPTPPTKAIWVDESPVQFVVDYAKKLSTPTIFWYQSKAVCAKLKELGFPGPVVLAGEPVPKQTKANKFKHIALSIPSHGTGLNLQDRSSNFVIEPPTNGKAWEQMIARTHRPGQLADEVVVKVLQHTEPFREAFEKAMLDARFMEAMNGQQKLLYATINFLHH